MSNADDSKDVPVLLKPTNLNQLLFTKRYPGSHELENHLS